MRCSRLRVALGDELVRRSGQGVSPTPRAMSLWPSVRDALRQLQQSLAPDDFVPAEADNAFVLAMADATAVELVPRLMAIAAAEAPGVSMRVVPLATRDPRKAARRGDHRPGDRPLPGRDGRSRRAGPGGQGRLATRFGACTTANMSAPCAMAIRWPVGR